jgi:hypothetical protein
VKFLRQPRRLPRWAVHDSVGEDLQQGGLDLRSSYPLLQVTQLSKQALLLLLGEVLGRTGSEPAGAGWAHVGGVQVDHPDRPRVVDGQPLADPDAEVAALVVVFSPPPCTVLTRHHPCQQRSIIAAVAGIGVPDRRVGRLTALLYKRQLQPKKPCVEGGRHLEVLSLELVSDRAAGIVDPARQCARAQFCVKAAGSGGSGSRSRSPTPAASPRRR